jgi:hypothetical protein
MSAAQATTYLTQGEIQGIVSGEEELLSLSRFCKRWGVSKSTGRRLIENETIVPIRTISGRIYLRASEGLKLLRVAEL